MATYAELDAAWKAARASWKPFGRFSDLECGKPDCWREALIEEGVRIHLCAEHLAALESFTPLLAERAELVKRDIIIDHRDLTLQQRAWVPDEEAWGAWEWPHADRVEVWEGVMMFENRFQLPWTWRSVAIAARAYPDRRVRLVGSYLQVPYLSVARANGDTTLD